jgi:hypothetical protein
MARTRRISTITALIACLLGTQLSGTLFASDQGPSSGDTPSAQPLAATTSAAAGLAGTDEPLRLTLDDDLFTSNAALRAARAQGWRTTLEFVPVESNAFAQRGFRGRGRRNEAAQTEIILGAVASIAGAAILVYANRPDCGPHPNAGGCGYGTKVVGGAVLSVGVVSMLVGALTYR